MINKPFIVAIDGYSSTGKSTLAKQLAKHLNFIYVDTGAMYRAVALFAMENDCVADNNIITEKLIAKLPEIHLSFQLNTEKGFVEMYLNHQNVEQQIRTLEVSQKVSKVAAISEVRTKLVEQQQAMGKNKGLVMDGRDIATVVFPNAEIKLFMSASPITRAQRRYNELIAKGEMVSFEEILQNVQERDYMDTHREDSPLVIASDAIEIDNSNLSREAQFELVLDIIKDKHLI
jgi:cytidylate kinase